jgi:hydrogenase maturation protein HypF
MQKFKLSLKNNQQILALGAESQGNFSYFNNGFVFFSDDFGDLNETSNLQKFRDSLNTFLKDQKIPTLILCDFHPFFSTTKLAQNLAKKYKAKLINVQHHHAHIFSAIGDDIILHPDGKNLKLKKCIGVACDGTGYGLDEKIWGGEFFLISSNNISRIGHLENHTLIGGELAIKEPARMLISLLSKFMPKEEVFLTVKKYYNKNEFELLWNQMQQEFNCIETSSTARILDACSILLGFSGNKPAYKHQPAYSLEKESTKPYSNLRPEIQTLNSKYILQTTPLFKYLISNLTKDKHRLAATAQQYLAEGIFEIIKKNQSNSLPVFFAGGMANNKIISKYLHSNKVHINKKIPRGDAGISLGQIFFFLLTNPRD